MPSGSSETWWTVQPAAIEMRCKGGKFECGNDGRGKSLEVTNIMDRRKLEA